mmetsp:Transcript_10444/g.31924  ORF Transcript_10444/g.31924 Transcript_10444/m.31924 type:complete len:225 (-) Transcript_10444:657-1331(-)
MQRQDDNGDDLRKVCARAAPRGGAPGQLGPLLSGSRPGGAPRGRPEAAVQRNLAKIPAGEVPCGPNVEFCDAQGATVEAPERLGRGGHDQEVAVQAPVHDGADYHVVRAWEAAVPAVCVHVPARAGHKHVLQPVQVEHLAGWPAPVCDDREQCHRGASAGCGQPRQHGVSAAAVARGERQLRAGAGRPFARAALPRRRPSSARHICGAHRASPDTFRRPLSHHC